MTIQYYYEINEDTNKYNLLECEYNNLDDLKLININEVVSIDYNEDLTDIEICNQLAFMANNEFDIGITANDISFSG